MGVTVEIHAAEGGDDAKSLVFEQFAIYGKVAVRNQFTLEIVESRPGLIVFRASGKGAEAFFAGESGGHRWQRTPPNEKRGRVHTSTVTVAVLPDPTEVQLRVDQRDLEWSTCRGSGPGGQNRNKTETAVVLKHIPTGETVRCENERSQFQNRQTALALLRARLWAKEQARVSGERAQDRKRQLGAGQRGDKRRTIRVQDGQVKDHLTGRTWRYEDYTKGQWG